ncbi:hypothetical protein [Trichloromonas sp.]|uniref:hypothetical protein n=1 Tax=Trichloromonas sp. TaxID=3069249 RepID=UPI002A48D189|nr:hypothetical protein [Trichloromonas sp.]
MPIIKKFNQFDKNFMDNNERDQMERELNYRKIKRMNDDNDISFDFIKKEIKFEIDNNIYHKISIGNTIEEIDGSKKSSIHIEYESDNLGRIRIFKPENEARKGFFEYNGKMFKINVTEVREFFIFLSTKIK